MLKHIYFLPFLPCEDFFCGHCMFCVALSMDLFVLCVACLTGFANYLTKQCLGVFVIEYDGSCCVWLEVLYWIDHVWSSIECLCCACGPSVCVHFSYLIQVYFHKC